MIVREAAAHQPKIIAGSVRWLLLFLSNLPPCEFFTIRDYLYSRQLFVIIRVVAHFCVVAHYICVVRVHSRVVTYSNYIGC